MIKCQKTYQILQSHLVRGIEQLPNLRCCQFCVIALKQHSLVLFSLETLINETIK